MSSLSDFVGGSPQLWVSGTAYAAGKVVWSPTDYQYFMRKSAGGGTTDPASDTTNWQPTGDRAIKSIQRGVSSSTSITISSVNTAKTELRYLGGNSNVTIGGALEGPARMTLSSATTIAVSYPGGSGNISWELTERY